jgi:hypothetical protein
MMRHLGVFVTFKRALTALLFVAAALVSRTSSAVVIWPAYDGYITSPLTGTAVPTTDSLTISGLAHNPHAGTAPMTIDISAYNYDTQAWDYLTTATIAANATPVMTLYETMYRWSVTLSLNNPGTQYEYWLPTYPYPAWAHASAFETSQGRLALMAVGNGPRSFGSFDPGRASCLAEAGNTAALYNCASGEGLVVFYQPGVTQSPVSYSGWTTVAGNGSTGPGPFAYSAPGFAEVAWEVQSYVVDGHAVYNFLCEPVDTRPIWQRYLHPAKYPVQVYNHGGFSGITGTFDSSNLDKTTDPLGVCLSAAQNGWLAVASSYRGEQVSVGPASNQTPEFDIPEDTTQQEYCLGEVTDVLALLDQPFQGQVHVG